LFYIRYLFSELLRRPGRTLTATIGLAIASSLIILIMSGPQTLSDAQNQVLNPLNNVGTDVLVTRSITADRLSDVTEETRQDFLSENATETDLSTLGDPGEEFASDQFKSESLITFESSSVENIDPSLVSNYSTGLILAVTHQEGTIPEVSVSIETGGETFKAGGEIEGLTDAEAEIIGNIKQQAAQDCGAQGLDPKSPECRAYTRSLMNEALPDRFKSNEQTFTTERQTITQQAGPISTDIQTSIYKVGGVDTSNTDIGLILPSEIIEGNYLSSDDQVVINKAYADKNDIQLNDSFSINDKEYSVVGFVEPLLYTNSADAYLTLSELQSISDKNDRVNILLAEAADIDALDATKIQLEGLISGAIVITSEDTADTISGSLVQAADLTDRFVQITSIIIIGSAFVIVSLLTVSAVSKRTREIGTLKAIGWSKKLVIRQIISENLVIGIVGAILGIVLGFAAITAFNGNNVALEAFIENADSNSTLVRSSSTTISAIQTSVDIQIDPSAAIFALGVSVAIIGAVVAGTLASLKAARLKPQEALRSLE